MLSHHAMALHHRTVTLPHHAMALGHRTMALPDRVMALRHRVMTEHNVALPEPRFPVPGFQSPFPVNPGRRTSDHQAGMSLDKPARPY
jgi:hypothetical protein